MSTPPPRPRRKRKKRPEPKSFPVSPLFIGGGFFAIILLACILLIATFRNHAERPEEIAQKSIHGAQDAELDSDAPVESTETSSSSPTSNVPDLTENATAGNDHKEESPVDNLPESTANESVLPSSPTASGGDSASPKSDSSQDNENQTARGPTQKYAGDLPKPAPPIPDIPLPINDDDFTRIREAIRRERRAIDGLTLFEAFSKSHDFTERQQERVDDELKKWMERARGDLYRLGTQWVTEESLRIAEKESSDLLKAADEAAEREDWGEVIRLLETASRANPNSIRPDYILGLFYSLPFMGANGPEKAEEYFDRVLAREPDDAPALNSRAIARMKQHRFGFAIRDLQRASELLDDFPEVGHNLGRFLQLAEDGQLKPDQRDLNSGKELYERLLSRNADYGLQDSTGWLHMRPMIRDDEDEDLEEAPSSQPDEDAQQYFLYSKGSGFLIADEYFLTNRHVIHDARLGVADRVSIEMAGPDNTRPVQFGTVVAVSADVDLALLHIPGATGEPLPLMEDLAELASDILILGYPKSDVLGGQLKATQGVIAGLPTSTESYYLLDATSDHGNSGGPILNRSGGVVSILTIGYDPIEVRADLTGGVTSKAALSFVTQHIPLQPMFADSGSPEKAEWSELAKKFAPSVVQVKTYYRAGLSTIDRAAVKAAVRDNFYEDKTCATCSGRQRIACESRNCIKGEIQIRRMETRVVGNNNLKRTITVPVFSKVDCQNCVQGTVECPFCSNGYDYRLR